MTSKNSLLAASEKPFRLLVTSRMISGSGVWAFAFTASFIASRVRSSISGRAASILLRSSSSVT